MVSVISDTNFWWRERAQSAFACYSGDESCHAFAWLTARKVRFSNLSDIQAAILRRISHLEQREPLVALEAISGTLRFA
jgi:hypothetical protein